MIRKEMWVMKPVMENLRKMVTESGIMDEDDSDWPMPDVNGRLELEIVCGRTHVSFCTSKIGSMADIQACKDPESLKVFHYLTQDLKCYVISLMNLHFRVKPF